MSPQVDLRLLFCAPGFRWWSLIWKEEDAEPRAARRPVCALRLPGPHGDVQRLCWAARGTVMAASCVCPAWGRAQPAGTAEQGSTRPPSLSAGDTLSGGPTGPHLPVCRGEGSGAGEGGHRCSPRPGPGVSWKLL